SRARRGFGPPALTPPRTKASLRSHSAHSASGRPAAVDQRANRVSRSRQTSKPRLSFAGVFISGSARHAVLRPGRTAKRRTWVAVPPARDQRPVREAAAAPAIARPVRASDPDPRAFRRVVGEAARSRVTRPPLRPAGGRFEAQSPIVPNPVQFAVPR